MYWWPSISGLFVQFVIILMIICFNINLMNAGVVLSTSARNPHLLYAPKGMQNRRLIWSDDTTMDDIVQGVANGAQVMKQMLVDAFVQPVVAAASPLMKFHKNYDYQPAATTTHIKYIIRPKKILHIKKIPRKIIKIITVQPSASSAPSPHSAETTEKFLNSDQHSLIHKEKLRQMEQDEEKRVEATMNAIYPDHHHHHHPSNTGDNEDNYKVITGKIHDFDSSWTPVSGNGEHYQQGTRSYPVSTLHINVDSYVTPQDPHSHHSHHHPQHTKSEINNYEVTETAAEETMQIQQSYRAPNHTNKKLSLNNNNSNKFTKANAIIKNNGNSGGGTSTTSTSEKPNYPDYILNQINKSVVPTKDCSTELPFFQAKEPKLLVGSSKSNQHYSNIQSVTKSTPTKLKPIRKYSSKFKKNHPKKTTVSSTISSSSSSIGSTNNYHLNIPENLVTATTDQHLSPTGITTTKLTPQFVTSFSQPITTRTTQYVKWNEERERSKRTERGKKKFGEKNNSE